MYKATINSLYENPFKLNVKTKELPFGIITKIKNEVHVLSDQGIRKILIEIESEQEIIYMKSCQVSMVFNIDKSKIKISLKNVTIKKAINSEEYELLFENIIF